MSAPVDPDLEAALAKAPEVEWLTPEQRAESDEALERLLAGRARLVRDADRAGALAKIARGGGDVAPELDLDAIEARAKAATPGPWRHGLGYDQQDPGAYVCQDFGVGHVVATGLDPISPEDAAHIAGMDPPTTLALVAEVRRLREEVARLAPKPAQIVDLTAREPIAQLYYPCPGCGALPALCACKPRSP